MFCVLSQPLVFMSTELFGVFGVAHKQPEFRQAVHAADALLTNWGESWYRGSDGFAADVIAFRKINYRGLHGGNYNDRFRCELRSRRPDRVEVDADQPAQSVQRAPLPGRAVGRLKANEGLSG